MEEMHKYSIKEVEVRKVVFKDVLLFVNIKQNNSIDVNAKLHVCIPIKLLVTNMMRPVLGKVCSPYRKFSCFS